VTEKDSGFALHGGEGRLFVPTKRGNGTLKQGQEWRLPGVPNVGRLFIFRYKTVRNEWILKFEITKRHLFKLSTINWPRDIHSIVPDTEIRADRWEPSSNCPAEVHVVSHPECVDPLALFDHIGIATCLGDSSQRVDPAVEGNLHGDITVSSTLGNESTIKVIVPQKQLCLKSVFRPVRMCRGRSCRRMMQCTRKEHWFVRSEIG